MMMKTNTVLKNFKMKDVDSYFFSSNPTEEFSKWDSLSLGKVSQKVYMLEYYDLKIKK